MKDIIINAFAADSRNIGDLTSAPTNYFDFPYQIETLDIRSVDPKFPIPKSGFGGSITWSDITSNIDNYRYHFIIGGGGLLYKNFLGCFDIIRSFKSILNGKFIAWGVGQQTYELGYTSQKNILSRLKTSAENFDYKQYLVDFDLTGIRDKNTLYPWVPCASCLHPTFDKSREIQHDYVVFSHRKYRIKINGLPQMSHDTQDLESVIDFLGSGDTIITSSYHGAYWGLLLGRKVLAFPFSTKFLTLQNPPALYPVSQWKFSKIQLRPFRQSFLNKIKLEFQYGDYYSCQINNWQSYALEATPFLNTLKEYRQSNQDFYELVKSLLLTRESL
jgi:hypothetical protein